MPFGKGESEMKRATIGWLITAVLLVIVGSVLFSAAMWKACWNFAELGTQRYETNKYEITEDFRNIALNVETSDVVFSLSRDGTCRVECLEWEKQKHAVSVQNGTLVVSVTDTRAWYDYIGIHFGAPKLTIYLPHTEYASLQVHGITGALEVPNGFSFEDASVTLTTGSVQYFASASGTVRIKTTTGAVYLQNVSAGALDLSVTTGKMTVSDVICAGDLSVNVTTGKTELTNVSCKNFLSDGSTGKILLNRVIASGSLTVRRSTGDVLFDRCDAASLSVTTDTGDVTGTLLTEKTFITDTDTGKIDVPKNTSGGICEITTDTGDIRLKIQ